MNEIIEEWKPVVGYEGLYEVSNLGRVKSLKANKGKVREKILRQIKMKNVYLQVNLYKEGKMKQFLVHRLVANAFIDNPSSLPCVNHKDENKTNNCVNNLEWCTYQYNNTYGTVVQRRVANTDYKARTAKIDYKAFQERRVANTNYKARTAKIDYKEIAEKQSRQVYQYSLDGELVKVWQSTAECGRNDYKQSAVAACCNGDRKSHKGYIWSYTPIHQN